MWLSGHFPKEHKTNKQTKHFSKLFEKKERNLINSLKLLNYNKIASGYEVWQRTIPFHSILTLNVQTNHPLESWRETHLNSYSQVLKTPKIHKIQRKSDRAKLKFHIFCLLYLVAIFLVLQKEYRCEIKWCKREKKTQCISLTIRSTIFDGSVFIISFLTLFCLVCIFKYGLVTYFLR